MLYGRARERLVIEGLLARARAGRSGALVIRGEAGVGKTALLDYAAAAAGAVASGNRASDDGACGGAAPGDAAPPGTAAVRVLRGGGVESESALPLAGLQLLLGSALDRRAALPQPQREALAAAVGLRRAEPDDRFLVGLAVGSLLAELAQDGPLVCLVDDAQWLDRASAQALVFAARRLGATPIAVIFAARDHEQPSAAAGLPQLRLGGLDAAAAAALLAEHGGAGLPAAVRDRILAQARGNPLGIIELSAAWRDTPAGGWPGPGALVLTERLQQAFAGPVRRLAASTQTMLLAAAADDSGDLGVVLAAARALGAGAADLGPAEQAGLIRIVDGVVRFRHPLVGAAVYQGAPLGRRLAVHRALAEVLGGAADADRRAWQLAAAASGPDEQVAGELERTAATARARSGYAAAAAAYERSVQLTTDPAARTRRLALAAQAAVEVGEFDRARRLAAGVAGQPSNPIGARLAGVRALADFAQGRLPSAHRLLVNGAAQLDEHDPLAATRMLLHALQIAWLAGDRRLLADTAGRLQQLGAAHAQPLAPLLRLLSRSATPAGQQPTDGLPRLADLVAAARRVHAGHHDDLAMIATVCLATGRTADARELTAALIADAHAQGRIGSLPALLTCRAQALVLEGRHGDALASAGQALRIARDTGHTPWASQATAVLAWLAAVGGDQARCHRLADAALAGPAGVAGTPWVRWALGLLELGRGRPEGALAQLERIAGEPLGDHVAALRSIPDLVEAAVRLGQPQRAAEPLARLCRWAHHTDTPSTDALLERCHALLAADGDHEPHYLAALKLDQGAFEQARTQLLYGAWLRRARRKAHARTQLRAAIDGLDRIGAAPWAELARVELRATGTTTSPPAGRAGPGHLTPQELQVARLAAQGLSNRDIAAQLLLSPRTVSYHLYKAYPKLAITSRSQLDPATLRP